MAELAASMRNDLLTQRAILASQNMQLASRDEIIVSLTNSMSLMLREDIASMKATKAKGDNDDAWLRRSLSAAICQDVEILTKAIKTRDDDAVSPR